MSNRTRRTSALLAVLALTAAVLFSSATPAAADHADWPLPENRDEPVEQNTGVLSSAPSSPTFCVFNRFAGATAKACWVANGDIWYVQDLSGDGRSAIAIWEDWICTSSTSCRTFWRQGVCRNPHGNGTWARCNKDYAETGHVIYFASGTSEGSDVHIMDFGPFVTCRPQTSCSL